MSQKLKGFLIAVSSLLLIVPMQFIITHAYLIPGMSYTSGLFLGMFVGIGFPQIMMLIFGYGLSVIYGSEFNPSDWRVMSSLIDEEDDDD